MAKKDGVSEQELKTKEDNKIIVTGPARRKLPKVRTSRTYKFQVADLDGYFTVSEYSDGKPGELFINVSKQGSTLSGLLDSFAISVSLGLQYGVPLKHYAKLLRGTSFAPYGITDDQEIRTASSITDYIMRRLSMDYLSFDDRLELGMANLEDLDLNQTQTSLIDDQPVQEQPGSVSLAEVNIAEVTDKDEPQKVTTNNETAPLCYNCGNITQRSGSCFVCTSCGSTTGCS